jgi:hypothetical protein
MHFFFKWNAQCMYVWTIIACSNTCVCPQCNAAITCCLNLDSYLIQQTLKFWRKASCHVGFAGTYLIIEVKQRWARLVLGLMTAQKTSMLGAVRKWSRILWHSKASEKTHRRLRKRLQTA